MEIRYVNTGRDTDGMRNCDSDKLTIWTRRDRPDWKRIILFTLQDLLLSPRWHYSSNASASTNREISKLCYDELHFSIRTTDMNFIYYCNTKSPNTSIWLRRAIPAYPSTHLKYLSSTSLLQEWMHGNTQWTISNHTTRTWKEKAHIFYFRLEFIFTLVQFKVNTPHLHCCVPCHLSIIVWLAFQRDVAPSQRITPFATVVVLPLPSFPVITHVLGSSIQDHDHNHHLFHNLFWIMCLLYVAQLHACYAIFYDIISESFLFSDSEAFVGLGGDDM